MLQHRQHHFSEQHRKCALQGRRYSNRKAENIAGKTVAKYISMLRNAFVFFSVSRYDVKGKQLLKTLGKNYIIDIGFRNMLLGYRDADRGHIIENIVFLELLRRDYRVYIGKIGETMDRSFINSYDGIKSLNLINWLLDE